jgi:Mrp family chromosome partitioning ATPase
VPILIELLSEDTEVIRANYHRDPKEMPKEEPPKKKSLFGKPKKEEAPKTESTTTSPAPQEAAPQQSSLGAYAKMPGAGVSVQVEQESASVSDDNDMDMDDDFGLMSLGGYGNRHTDTGYLDDYSYDETEDQPDVAEEPEEEEVEEEEEEIPTDENAISLIDYNKFNGIVLVTGERGVGVTKFVIETAVALYNGGRGKKVLIVDCDYRRNGALSYIEVEDFYAQECYNGIEKVKFYHDIEADIISNGYGVPVTKQQIYNLLHNSNLDAMYDVILVDCPTDCLNSISERAIKSQKVIVLANGDRGSLMATSIALTDKTVVEGPLQRYIMRTCTPGIGEYSEHYLEDVEFVRRIMFFPDGCWLDNLGIEE